MYVSCTNIMACKVKRGISPLSLAGIWCHVTLWCHIRVSRDVMESRDVTVSHEHHPLNLAGHKSAKFTRGGVTVCGNLQHLGFRHSYFAGCHKEPKQFFHNFLFKLLLEWFVSSSRCVSSEHLFGVSHLCFMCFTQPCSRAALRHALSACPLWPTCLET